MLLFPETLDADAADVRRMHDVTRRRTILATAIFVSALTCLCAPSSSRAQTGVTATAREILVSFDRDGKVTKLDSSAAEVSLPQGLDRSGWIEGTLWRTADGGFVLQIFRQVGSQKVQDRVRLTDVEVDAIRARVESLAMTDTKRDPKRDPAELGAPGRLDRRGRAMLLTGGALLGVGFYSWSVPLGADLEGKTAVGVGMLSAAAGFALPYLPTQRGEVTPGMTNLALWGGTRGALHGYLLRRATERRYEPDTDPRAAAAVLGSLVEGAAGFVIAKQTDLSAGDAHMIGVGGDFGLISGFAFNEMFQVDAGDYGDEREASATFLIASAVGMAGAAIAAPRTDWTWGDAEVFRACGLLGAAVGTSIATIATDEGRPIAAGAIAGAGLGMFLGRLHLRDREYRPNDAILVELGSVAGAALGAGAAYLLSKENQDESLYISIGTLGALGGFFVTDRMAE